MKNIEKYKDEIIKKMEDGRSLSCSIQAVRTNVKRCGMKPCAKCSKESFDWLNAECIEPIKLTLAEKCILESLDKKYKWIVRDKIYEGLYVCTNKPTKTISEWIGGNYYYGLDGFKHLFQFIKWEDEEPYNIKELLANCEVVEKEK